VFAIYGLITEQDVGNLFIAGIIPGILAVSMYMITDHAHRLCASGLPAGRASARRRARSFRAEGHLGDAAAVRLRDRRASTAACSPRRRRPGAGAGGAFVIGVARRKLSGQDILRSLLETTRTTAAVFTILIGALLFGYFLTITQTPQKVTEFLTGLGIGSYGVLALIMLMYLVLGCLMDALAMIILTVPIIFPVIRELGFDPIWFGVIIVMTVELGPDPSAGRHEHLRDKKRDRGRQDIDHLLWRDAVHRHRPAAPGDPDRVPDHRDLAAVAYVSELP
jgi:hypothetical protein